MIVICRALTSDDYTDARALYQTLTTGHSLPDPKDGIVPFERLLAHPGTRILGAQMDGQIISMATLHVLPNMTYHAKPYALIENVATLPNYQGNGYGRSVMQAAAHAAWAAGVYKIMLLTGQLHGAKGFYEQLGYIGDEKHGMILRRPPT